MDLSFPFRIHAPLIQIMRSGSCLSGQCTALICGSRYKVLRKQQKWRTAPKRDRSRCVGNTGRTIQQASRCLGCEWFSECVETSAPGRAGLRATGCATASGTRWSGRVRSQTQQKISQVTSLNVVIVIRRRQLFIQPNKGDKMESSRVGSKRPGHLLSKCSALCTCGATL